MAAACTSKNGKRWDLRPFQNSVVKEKKKPISPLGVLNAFDAQ